MNENTTYSFDQILRYKLIEIIVLWEGRLTTNHLCQYFGIGRQQASKDINYYLKQIAPSNLFYDSSLKGYIPGVTFKPKFTFGTVDEYLTLLSEKGGNLLPFDNTNKIISQNIELLQPPTRHIKADILRGLIQAIKNKRRIELGYVSLNNPKIEDRIIEPHSLINTGQRWHVRAYCEKNRDFRDFVLSRFRREIEIYDEALIDANKDKLWHTPVRIKIIPDTRLNKAQRKIIAEDYGMKRNALIINSRAALVNYILKLFQLDPNKVEALPQAQQLMIGNLSELKKWLF